jgi:hypothetical protein
MDTGELVSIVLADDLIDSSTIQNRFKHVLVPLLDLRQECSCVDYLNLDNAVVATCLGILKETNISSVGLELLSKAVEILRAARFSYDEADRVIRKPQLYVDCVLAFAKGLFTALKLRSLQVGEAKAVVDLMWRTYECLPEQLPDWEASESLSRRFDMLYIDVIGLDVCSGWPIASTNIFEYFPVHFEQPAEQDRTKTGHEVASLLCKSFCDQLNHTTDATLVREVLKTLLEDLKDFDQLCFQRTLDLPLLVNESLARPLLVGQHIDVLGVLFEIGGKGLVDADLLSHEVLSLYKAALYGENSSEDEIRVATQCHEILGRWMPSIEKEFAHSGKFLAASHMISSVLTDEHNTCVLLPKDIRRMNPFEVIDFVLKQNPLCFIQHCPEWSDANWAATTNETNRRYFESRNEIHFVERPHQKLSALPPLPGIPVFRLAELIGLEDIKSIVAVKSRIILHGIDVNLHGPSAAICRTLLADVATADTDCLPALEATAKIVSDVRYRDAATKRELCLAALQLRKDILRYRIGDFVESIARAYEHLEYEWVTSRLFGGGGGALYQAQKEIQNDYSVSLPRLMGSLQKHLCDLVFDDELLAILARYCFLWCIGRATKPVIYPYHPLYAVVTDAMLSLASAISLHIVDISKFETLIAEITKVIADYQPSAFADWVKPDANLVDRLVKRGYSECGARRAVGMTHNAGFDTAIQWAVQHSLDKNFDDPILLIRPVRDLRLDSESMELCQVYFACLQRCREIIECFDKPAEKSVEAPPDSDRHPRNNIDDEDAWLEDDGFELDSQENESVPIDLDGKDSPIVGGWNDHDEIDLDLDDVHDLTDSKDGRGGWGKSGVDLNTILEGEHEMNVDLDGMMPIRDASAKQDNEPPEGASKHDEAIQSKQAGQSEWEAGVGFTDPSADGTNDLYKLSDVAEQSPDAEVLDDSSPPEDGGHQGAIDDKMAPIGESASPLHLSTENLSQGLSRLLAASKSNDVLQVTTTPFTQTVGDHLRRDPSAPLPSPRSAPLPRSKLLQAGQEAFANAKKACSPPVEERRRLIEQGRAFFKQVKSSSALVHNANRSFFSDTPRTVSAPSANPFIVVQPHDKLDDTDLAK